MFIELDEAQKETIRFQLSRIGLGHYQPEVEMVMLGEAPPQMVLDLLRCFYIEGQSTARALLELALNNYLRKRVKKEK